MSTPDAADGTRRPPPDEAAEWHHVAEERRRQLERLQGQALYRLAAAVLAQVRRLSWSVRRVVEPVRGFGIRLVRSVVALPMRVTAPRREARLRVALAALPDPAGVPAEGRGRLVTAVVVTAHQPARLTVLLAALDRQDVPVLVVDNAGGPEVAEVIAQHPRATRLRLDRPLSFAEANEFALGRVTTPWALLLNDDVAPFDERWLDRMLAAADTGTVAVGAQLVHGRRGLLGGAALDGRVQHAGIGLVLDGPLVRPVHLGRGGAPEVTDVVRDVPAATAACLLVRMAAHRAVGGLHLGFDYGMEDVDLCVRLATQGRVRVALGALLSHEEGATRLVDRHSGDRRTRAARQASNRALLDARHGPRLRAAVLTQVLAEAAAAVVDGTPDGPLPTSPVLPELVLRVAGPVPELLTQVLATLSRPAVVVRDGPAAAVVVTDPGRLSASGDPARDVPIVAWADTASLGGWGAAALDAVDALIVTGAEHVREDGQGEVEGRVGPEAGAETPLALLAAVAPTLPSHRVDGVVAARAALAQVLLAPRWTVRIGAPGTVGARGAAQWGDTPVAEALRRELRALGTVARVAGRDAWGTPVDRGADVTLHLKGRGVAPVAPSQVNIVWVMSHPSEVAPGELDAADLVLAASDLLGERLRARTTTPVVVMHQAADGRRFQPGPVDPARASRVLFIGNTRSVPRPAVLAAIDAGLPLTLIGSGWERYVDPRRVARRSVPPEELPTWYRSAEVVLNDHWDEMRRWGIVSNRVFEVLACGGCVVSDAPPGIDVLLDDAVATAADPHAFPAVVTRLLADPAERRERGARGMRAVRAAHTWEQRASALVQLVAVLPRGGDVE
jgi:GT2 family glycosyltransferase